MKFDYGQQVIYKPRGAANIDATKVCSVVAITPVDTSDQAEAFGYPQGTVMYTVEFGDGTDEFVPEDYLQAV